MRKREYYWSLHHAPRKKRFDDLRTDQVEAIFSVLPSDDVEEWQVWREGFTSWKSFEEFPILLEQLRGAPHVAVEPPPTPKESLKILDRKMEKTIEFELEGTATKKEGGAANREKARYEGSFTVKIKVGESTFVSKTVNISLNGIQLENPLPKNLPKYFPIGLFANREMIPLLCSAVPSSVGPATRLRIESNEYEDVLRTWLIQFGKRE